MKNTLYDLTKEDWNTLFPIKLVDHNPQWKDIYEREKELIMANASAYIRRIEHFGSTSIPAIRSKPYIDILIEIPEDLLFDEKLIEVFEKIRYTDFKVPSRENIDAYSSFGKG